MANEKTKLAKPVPRKKFTFFGGIFLCLISVIFIVNIGPVARFFTYLPSYLFGCVSFFIYIFIYILGLSFLIRDKGLKIKLNHIFFGFLLIFIALVVGTACGYNMSKFGYVSVNDFNRGFNVLDWFNTDKVSLFTANRINLGEFDEEFFLGGGVVGIFIVESLAKIKGMTGNVVIVISILVLVIGLVLLFMTKIRQFFASDKPAKEKQNKEQVSKKVVQNEPVLETKDEIASTKVEQSQINFEMPKGNLYIGGGSFDIARFRRSSNNIDTTKTISSAQANETVIKEELAPSQAKFKINGGYEEPKPQNTDPYQGYEQEIDNGSNTVENEWIQGSLFQDEEVKPVVNQNVVQSLPENTINSAVASRMVSPAPAIDQTPELKAATKKPIKWIPPDAEMLEVYETSAAESANIQAAEERKELINQSFADFNIGANAESYTIGPSVTRFNISYSRNEMANSIAKREIDISRRLGGLGVRFTPIVEGLVTSGLEVPNVQTTTVSFKEVFSALEDPAKKPLLVPFGKNINGEVVSAEFNDFPHMIVAGTTGSGKSIFVHSIIASLIMRNAPDKLKLVIVDPKGNEMGVYEKIPHLLTPIIVEAPKAKMILSKLVDEMNDRFKTFKAAQYSSDIKEYNKYAVKNNLEQMPYIIVVIDEFADLIENCKEISGPVQSIAQKARAAGIFMLIATQRPSTNVITGTIKANMPTHVALMTGSAVDSQTIIGTGGAEKLLGKGDMLVQCPLISKNGSVRLQGCYVTRGELSHICNYLQLNYPQEFEEKFFNLEESAAVAGKAAVASGEVTANEDNEFDLKYNAIKDWVMTLDYVSISKIQRDCAVGFNRAGRIFNKLVAEGVVGTETVANRGSPVLVKDSSCLPDVDSVPVSSDSSYIR